MRTGKIAGQYLKAAIVTLTVSWAAPSAAGDREGEFAVFTVGAHTCNDYLLSRRRGGPAFAPYEQWLMGYLSAFNLIVADTYDIMGKQNRREAIRWLDGYCTQRGDAAFIDACAALTVSLYPQRHASAPGTAPDRWNKAEVLRSAESAANR